ncbi:hypothetical protein MAR_010863, partial [Mya arenaria]
LRSQSGYQRILTYQTLTGPVTPSVVTNKGKQLIRIRGISDHYEIFVDNHMCATRMKQPARLLYMWVRRTQPKLYRNTELFQIPSPRQLFQ